MNLIRFLFPLILIISFFFTGRIYASDDSLCVLNLNDEKFIVYKVDYGQNYYSISRRFHTSIEEIRKANGDTVAELRFEQIILIPLGCGKKASLCEKKHVVKKDETLYSIARSNQLTVDDIRAWNHLKKGGLKYGDTLTLYIPGNCNEGIQNVSPVQKDDKKGSNKIEKTKSPHKDSIKIGQKTVDGEICETGAGTWLDNDAFEGKKNLALHKDAPIGTMIRLVNVMNGKEVWVKVVGHLPEKEEKSGIIIIISGYTAKILHIRDRNFRVKLYYPKHSVSSR